MNTVNNELHIYDLLMIDIETVPQYPEYAQLPDVWKSLWFDKNSKTVPENSTLEDLYVQKAGILAEFGKVICISTGYFCLNDNKELSFRIKSIYGDDEKTVLQNFITLIDKLYKHNKNFLFCGHNIREFDIPFLCRRTLIQHLKLPAALNLQGAKPWETKLIDTLQYWKFGDYKHYTSLHLLANVMDVPTSKTDIKGSDVQHVYHKEKNLKRIVEYCQRDIVVVANLILRFKHEPLLNEAAIKIVE